MVKPGVKRGDFVWLQFDPQAGREQAGHRPALVVSAQAFNEVTPFVWVVPITSQVKGYPFEVRIPDGLPVSGVILADQVKSLDRTARQLKVAGQAPPELVEEVMARIEAILRG